ncbi:unnamed protein product [Caenorhabditis bovis]|uniref:Uncharacterized protein n=1 Tax=Caenorhabditis bovis TaxID=2654633 RepID=A0A8S1E391_9PELO|nr:unnamed protein product [Caenorhabditis bovis]
MNKKQTKEPTVKAPECAMTPPSTPSSPTDENESIEFLYNSWQKFATTETGEPDHSIVVYRPEKDIANDFVPFDIDRFLAERLLKELDIDPKLALF